MPLPCIGFFTYLPNRVMRASKHASYPHLHIGGGDPQVGVASCAKHMPRHYKYQTTGRLYLLDLRPWIHTTCQSTKQNKLIYLKRLWFQGMETTLGESTKETLFLVLAVLLEDLGSLCGYCLTPSNFHGKVGFQKQS